MGVAVSARQRSPRAIRWSSWRAPASSPARRRGSATSGTFRPTSLFFAGLLALSCIDVEHLLLPKKIVYPVTVLVTLLLLMAAAITGHWHHFVVGVVCALGWFAVFFALNFDQPPRPGLR